MKLQHVSDHPRSRAAQHAFPSFLKSIHRSFFSPIEMGFLISSVRIIRSATSRDNEFAERFNGDNEGPDRESRRRGNAKKGNELKRVRGVSPPKLWQECAAGGWPNSGATQRIARVHLRAASRDRSPAGGGLSSCPRK